MHYSWNIGKINYAFRFSCTASLKCLSTSITGAQHNWLNLQLKFLMTYSIFINAA